MCKMRVDLQPPLGYEPLPPDVSETTAKLRWPVANPRKPYLPPKGQISVDGPLQSPPPKPRLRYHRQSSYTDAYVQFSPAVDRAEKPVSEWSSTIGKDVEFVGESMYERHFEWPPETGQAEKFPPLISTVGLGILPILGSKEKDFQLQTASNTMEKDGVYDKGVKNSTSCVGSTKPSYWVLNCNPHKPVERMWEEQTTHRIDYIVPPKVTRPSTEPTPPAEESRFQFIGTGKMETASTSMEDYSYPETENPISKDFLSRRNTFQAKEDKHQECPCHKADISSNHSETDSVLN